MLTPLVIALAFAVVVGLATVAYAHLIEPGWLRVRHRTIVVPGWHATADPLRILHLSDLHVGRANHLLARFMSSARAIPADLVVITGDFVDRPDRPENVEKLADVLRPLMDGARQVVGVLGNHDRYVYGNRVPHGPADPFDANPLIKAIKDSGVRLLVVEDDPDLNRQLASALKDAGYAVDCALDGEEGHFMGDTEPYDAVVLDIGLPTMDGISVLEQWRRDKRSMPVLILTARDRWSDKVSGMDAGELQDRGPESNIYELPGRQQRAVLSV